MWDDMVELFALRNKHDWRTVLWTFLYFASLYVTWLKFNDFGLVAKALMVVWMCYFAFAGATMTHNSMHCRVFRHTKTNLVFQALLSLTYGHPVSSYVPGHNLSHHKFTQMPKDSMRTTKLRFQWNLLNGLFFQPCVAGAVLKNDLRYLMLQNHLQRPYFWHCIQEFKGVAAATVLLLVIDFHKFLFLFYIPHLFAQWGIVGMNLLQHDGCDIVSPDNKDPMAHINAGRNFVGPILNFLTFNNGFHQIHHMHPTMHWSELPEAHKREVEPFNHPALNQPCMARYMWKTFINPGLRLDYKGTPVVLPEKDEGDEDWMDYPEGVTREQMEVTPAVALRALLSCVPLLPIKLTCPMLSPMKQKIF